MKKYQNHYTQSILVDKVDELYFSLVNKHNQFVREELTLLIKFRGEVLWDKNGFYAQYVKIKQGSKY